FDSADRRQTGLDGARSGARAMARVSRAAIPRGRHQDGQIKVAERPRQWHGGNSGHRLRIGAVLGEDRPGSEGNLAGDIDNQDEQSATVAATEPEKVEETPPAE